jgi:hypothetical protein
MFRNRGFGSFLPLRSPDDGGGTPAAPAAAPAAPAAPAPAADRLAPASSPSPSPTPAIPAAPTPAAATLAGGADPAVTPASPPAGKWPDSWRTELAAGDKTFEKMLERYDSPTAVAKGFRELRTKLDSGELKAPPKALAENATPEEAATWRKENGLPENAQAFVSSLKLPDGVVPGQQDQPLLSSFADQAMKAGWSQETYNTAVDWYYKMSDAAAAQRDGADADFHTDTLTELTAEWGKEFKSNQNAIGNFVNMFPEEFRSQFLLARTPDGKVLGDHPMFLRAALMLAKEINPASTVLPAAAGGGLSSVESRIAEIQGIMRDPKRSDQYWHGEGGAKMQAELRDLYSAQEKMKARAG